MTKVFSMFTGIGGFEMGLLMSEILMLVMAGGSWNIGYFQNYRFEKSKVAPILWRVTGISRGLFRGTCKLLKIHIYFVAL